MPLSVEFNILTSFDAGLNNRKVTSVNLNTFIWVPTYPCDYSGIYNSWFLDVSVYSCFALTNSLIRTTVPWRTHSVASLLPPTPTALPECFFCHPEKPVLVWYPPSRRRNSTGIYFQINDFSRSIFISGFLPGDMRWIVWKVSDFLPWLAQKQGRVAFDLFWLYFPIYNGASSFAIMVHIVVHVTADA